MENEFYTRLLAEFIFSGLGGGYAADGSDEAVPFTDGEGHPLSLDIRLIEKTSRRGLFGRELQPRERVIRTTGVGIVINDDEQAPKRVFFTLPNGRKVFADADTVKPVTEAVYANGRKLRLGKLELYAILRASFSERAAQIVKESFSSRELARLASLSEGEDVSPYMRFFLGKDALAIAPPDFLTDIQAGSNTALFMESRYAMTEAAENAKRYALREALDIKNLLPQGIDGEASELQKNLDLDKMMDNPYLADNPHFKAMLDSKEPVEDTAVEISPNMLRVALHNRLAEQILSSHPELLDVKVGGQSLYDFLVGGGLTAINPVKDFFARSDAAAGPAKLALDYGTDTAGEDKSIGIDTRSLPGVKEGLTMKIPAVSFAIARAMELKGRLSKLTDMSLEMDFNNQNGLMAGQNLSVVEGLKDRLKEEFRHFEDKLTGSSTESMDFMEKLRSKIASNTRETLVLGHMERIHDLVVANLPEDRAGKALEILCAPVLDCIKQGPNESAAIADTRERIIRVREEEKAREASQSKSLEETKEEVKEKTTQIQSVKSAPQNVQEEPVEIKTDKQPKEDPQEQVGKEKEDLLKSAKEFEESRKDIALGLYGEETHFLDPDKTGECSESEVKASTEITQISDIAKSHIKSSEKTGLHKASTSVSKDPAVVAPKINKGGGHSRKKS